MSALKRDGREFKEFRPTSFAVDHPTSVLVLLVIILISGLYSYATVPKESQPDIEIPNVAINTMYAGVSPEDIESLITRPIEEEINKISDVKTLRSTSVEGFSSINVEFEAGVDMTEALQQVREKVDIAKPELPPAAEEPAILEFSFENFP
ncbi:MAG: efflux RND transporter permease subunit, partial [Gemmatimonadales bacterium]